MSENIYSQLNEVFSDVLDEEVSLKAEMTANDVEGWDSLSHIQLIMAIEKKFKVRFSTSEIAKLKKVGDLVELIQAKSGK